MLIDKFKLFIFDWDGTLSTSSSLVRATRFAMKRYSIGEIEKHMDSYKVEPVKIVKNGGDINEFYAIAHGIYYIIYRPRLKEGAAELLQMLKRKGKKVAIFSDSNRYRLQIEAKRLGVIKYVDFILSGDSIKRFKPNPSGLVAITKTFGIRTKSSIYFGDMAADIFAARFAGMASCAISDGVDPIETLKQAKPDYLAYSLSDIKKLR